MHDIHALSVCWTDDVFTEALRLFFLKWEASGDKTVLPVLKHFRKVSTNNGVSLWASGHAHNCVVNNNGLESANGKIKDLVTQRHLMPLLDFLRAIMGWYWILLTWTLSRLQQCIPWRLNAGQMRTDEAKTLPNKFVFELQIISM